jgi:hypothetical protein
MAAQLDVLQHYTALTYVIKNRRTKFSARRNNWAATQRIIQALNTIQ